MNIFKIVLIFAIMASMVIILAVSWHSVEEIHYLKSFYRGSFTVEEAYYASAVELVKVVIISIPAAVLISVSLSLLKKS
jgi:hypothetical protein